MSGTIAPPHPVAPGSAEALFAEARRRRRRRRLAGLAVTLALAAAAAVAFTVAWPHRAAVVTDTGGRRPGAVSTAGATLAGFVAWVDYNRRVHIGDLATGAQRVVARSTADPAVPLVQAGGHLYWADYWAGLAGKKSVVVQELNPATGKVRPVGPGQSPFGVFTSANGRHVFLARTDTKVIELPARGSGAQRELTLPRGWYLPYGWSIGVAHGILVQSGGQATRRPHTEMAVWNPGTGTLKVITGRGFRVMAAYTPPSARYSLLAWERAGCSAGQNCPLKITNTATLSTKTLRSPLHHGFASGTAFSPDGKQLAVFLDRNSSGTGTVQLAMASTGTGTLRLAGSLHLPTSCSSGWALWLPDGRHLIAGGIKASYAVNAATLTARPLFFTHSRDHYIETSQDINYSAVLIPPHR
jgi:WD40 repeat protein